MSNYRKLSAEPRISESGASGSRVLAGASTRVLRVSEGIPPTESLMSRMSVRVGALVIATATAATSCLSNYEDDCSRNVDLACFWEGKGGNGSTSTATETSVGGVGGASTIETGGQSGNGGTTVEGGGGTGGTNTTSSEVGGAGGTTSTGETGGGGTTTTTETGGGGAGGGEPCMPPVGPLEGVSPNKFAFCKMGEHGYVITHYNVSAEIDKGVVIGPAESGLIDNLNKNGEWYVVVGKTDGGDICMEFINGDGEANPTCYVVSLPAGCMDGGDPACLKQVLPNYCGEGDNGVSVGKIGGAAVTIGTFAGEGVVCDMPEVMPPQ